MRKRTLTALVLLVATLVFGGVLAAQYADGRPEEDVACQDCKKVAELTARFHGFDAAGMAMFEVSVLLRPTEFYADGTAIQNPDGTEAEFKVVLRDAVPVAMDPIGDGNEKIIYADATREVRRTFLLTQAWFQRGPFFIDVLETRNYTVCRSIGPLQKPEEGSGVRPYGTVGAAANVLHLHVYGRAVVPHILTFAVYGAPEGYRGLLGVSLHAKDRAIGDGEMLIGPDLVTIELGASAVGDGAQLLSVQLEPWMAGLTVFAQAGYGRPVEDGREPELLLSNAVEIQVERIPDQAVSVEGDLAEHGVQIAAGDELALVNSFLAWAYPLQEATGDADLRQLLEAPAYELAAQLSPAMRAAFVNELVALAWHIDTRDHESAFEIADLARTLARHFEGSAPANQEPGDTDQVSSDIGAREQSETGPGGTSASADR